MNFESMSDHSILQELGERLRRTRLNQNLSQAHLAEKAGIGRRTLQKAEEGEVTTLATIVSLLRGLNLLSQLDNFLPAPPLSPVQLARLKGRERQRAARKGATKKSPTNPWRWGDS